MKAVDFVETAKVENPVPKEQKVFDLAGKAEVAVATVEIEKVATGGVSVPVRKGTVKAVDFVETAKVEESPVQKEQRDFDPAVKAEVAVVTVEIAKVAGVSVPVPKEAVKVVDPVPKEEAFAIEKAEVVVATVEIEKVATVGIFVLVEIRIAHRIEMKILETEREEMKDPLILSRGEEDLILQEKGKALVIEKGERAIVFQMIRQLPKRKLYYEKMPENALKPWNKTKKRRCSRI